MAGFVIGIGLSSPGGATLIPIGSAITWPGASVTLTEGMPYLVTGTLSADGTVDVLLGATVLGGAAVAALTWSYWFVPTSAQVGTSQTLSATATANVGGATSSASVTINIAAKTNENGAQSIGELAIGEFPIGGGALDATIPLTSLGDSRPPEVGSPLGVTPNQYTIGDSYRRARIYVPAGVTSLGIVGEPNAKGLATNIGVWVDNVYNTTLLYAGTFGVRATQTLTLDGSAHIVEFEEQASLVAITGTYKWLGTVQPDVRVVFVGDSIVAGVGATAPSKGHAPIVRHALPSNYGTTIWGISGRRLNGQEGIAGSVVQRCDGRTKNIIVTALMVNDWVQGVTPAAYSASMLTYLQAVYAAGPTVKHLLVTSPPKTTPVSGSSYNIQLYRDVAALYAAGGGSAQPNVFLLDLSTVYPGGSPYTTYAPDDTHPSDAGHALIAAAELTAILAL